MKTVEALGDNFYKTLMRVNIKESINENNL
jgi:hypothetical protein